MRKVQGEITVFLSLIFLLLFSFIINIFQSALIQTEKNHMRGAADRAVECLFAEYQKELFQTYGIFGLEGTYETGSFKEENILQRSKFYMQTDIEQEMEDLQLLTDHSGEPFLQQVTILMQDKIPLPKINMIQKESEKWQEDLQIFEKKRKNVKDNMDQLIPVDDQKLVEEETPLKFIEEIKNMGIVNIVMGDQEVSPKVVELEKMPSKRKLNKGRGNFKVNEQNAWSKIYLGEYIMDHFSSVAKKEETKPLEYELEYIVGGSKSDRENLEKVLHKLLFIRFIPNYTYLLTDENKKAEAEMASLVVSSIVLSPEITEVIKQAVLLVWAYEESILDLKSLVRGNKVPAVKNQTNWKSSLSSLISGDNSNVPDIENKEGISYMDYMKILLQLIPIEEITMKTMDLIEIEMKEKGYQFFDIDNCISGLKLKNRGRIRNITYEFYTRYKYR